MKREQNKKMAPMKSEKLQIKEMPWSKTIHPTVDKKVRLVEKDAEQAKKTVTR